MCGVKQAASTAFHPQTDGQTERVNRVMEDYLRHYADQQQTNWVSLLPFAEFAYNNANQDSTGFSPFYLNYGFNPTIPAVFHQTKTPDGKNPSSVYFLENIQKAIGIAKENLLASQQRQKTYADKKRQDISFKVGDKVLLSTKNLSVMKGASKKLLPRFIGPFSITKEVNEVAYKLDLPKQLKIHNVFHVSLLRKYNPNSDCKGAPLPEVIEGEFEYEVERILKHKKSAQGKIYLVKWKGYDESESTWEPTQNLTNCKKVLNEYKRLNNL
jgi:hypothetical protein